MAAWIQKVVKVGMQMLFIMNFHAFPQDFLCNQLFSKVSQSNNIIIILNTNYKEMV